MVATLQPGPSVRFMSHANKTVRYMLTLSCVLPLNSKYSGLAKQKIFERISGKDTKLSDLERYIMVMVFSMEYSTDAVRIGLIYNLILYYLWIRLFTPHLLFSQQRREVFYGQSNRWHPGVFTNLPQRTYGLIPLLVIQYLSSFLQQATAACPRMATPKWWTWPCVLRRRRRFSPSTRCALPGSLNRVSALDTPSLAPSRASLTAACLPTTPRCVPSPGCSIAFPTRPTPRTSRS